MGILRDTIGSVIEAAAESSQKKKPSSISRQMPPSRQDLSPYDASSSSSHSHQSRTRQNYDLKSQCQSSQRETHSVRDGFNTQQHAGYCYSDEPPSYSLHAYDEPSSSRPRSSQMPSQSNIYQETSYSYSSPETTTTNMRSAYGQPTYQNSDFRPLILPQVAFGAGEHFLRGYSSEISRYGVPRDQLLRVIDEINIARTPNPEAQLFQKGANIAGWFL
jgi:hypothetical protein